MAKKQTWSVVDDFDGSPAAETVTFALDGTTYEIDLSAENSAELREVLQPWIEAGRRSNGRRNGTTKTRSRTRASNGRGRRARGDSRVVREWASSEAGQRALRAANLKVPGPRGRISAAVLDAYNA